MDEAAVKWLREQVQARLEAARAADGPEWFLDSTEDSDERSVRYTGPSTLHPGQQADYYIADRVGVADAAHIALNDPRDVIAQCEAELGIITRCELVQAAFNDPAHGMWPDVSRRERTHANATLAMLAGGYKHREGYAEHWGG